MASLSRRKFLQASAATAAVTRILPQQAACAQASATGQALTGDAWPENGTLIPDTGWRLWVDTAAAWKNDAIFLPEDISQDSEGVVRGKGEPLPVNAPASGWGVLHGESAPGSIPVVLPSTVEQHFWGKFGSRPYTPEEYRYAAEDPVPMNGAYLGVSWWYRPVTIPAEMKGKRIFLHIRGAHLRAEVYLNQKLIGYSIMEELPFECDLTHAANPGGANLLAIRITNPFGRYDWVDGLNEQWGAVKLYRSHGFGGLDRGMTISAHPETVRILEAWVLNTPSPQKVRVNAVVEFAHAASDLTEDEITETIKNAAVVLHDEHGRRLSAEISTPQFNLLGNFTFSVALLISCPTASLWSVGAPHVYFATFTQKSLRGETDTRTIPFAFRSFTIDDLGSNALFRLNGKRTKIYTAISWGYWGINGMWPTPELATKEVTQAQKLNLNCLNFHRNLAKEDVLRAHDRLGVMRYMEPGAGKMAIGKLPSNVQANSAGIVMEKATSEADKFAQRYMFTKCVEMVKAFRSHPCVIEYCLQNEIGADLKNPDTIAILEAMHKEDPSRCVVLNDGFVAPPRKAAQAWFEPWDFDAKGELKSGKLHRSDEEEWGGWWNQHQGAGDQWYDEFYKGPNEFTYKSPERKVISEFGEMEGCATPDNHSLMLHQLADPKGTGIGNQPPNQSYDLADHKAIVAEYDRFLDKWGFRGAFPATEKLWTSLGKKCYDTWQNYLENARISDELDFCAISGWESTSIENHSGIVDNLRNFKSDPAPISGTLLPVRPVAKQRAMCTALGQSATFDLFLLNDTDGPASGTLKFTAVSPSGKRLELGEFPAPQWRRDQFSYLVREAVVTPPLGEEGMWRFRFGLSSLSGSDQIKEIWVTRADFSSVECKVSRRVALSGVSPALRRRLSGIFGTSCYSFVDFRAGERYDAIISSGLVTGVSGTQSAGDTTGLEAQPSSEVGAVQTSKQVGRIEPAVLDAVRGGTALLAIPQADTLSDGVARQLADAGAFAYNGNVGDFRAPWMGNWYFVRRHPVYDGLPVDQAMGVHYQARGRESNGLLVERAPGGAEVEIIAGYSRDHDRRIGAGTFATRLGRGRLLYQRVPELQPVLQARFLANALGWLTA